MTSALAALPRDLRAYEDARSEVIRDLIVQVARMWPPGRPQDPTVWFERYAGAYSDAVTLAQLEASLLSDWSVDAALEFQDVDLDPSDPELDLTAFTSTDGQGRPVMGQAYASAGQVGGAVEEAREAGGDAALALSQAWTSAGQTLAVATQTMVSDAARSVKSSKMLARNTGWVRVMTPPSCSRCAVLAGKFHRSATAGFQRHPGCDCTQIPVANRNDPKLSGLFAGPRDYFDTLTTAQQSKIFGQAGAAAIRDGADVGQVVNARRGMTVATDRFGTPTRVTTEGATKKGWAARYLRTGYGATLQKQPGSRYRRMDQQRLMPEEIYSLARGDRDVAMSLLHKNGYYTDASSNMQGEYSFYPLDADLREATERAQRKLAERGVRVKN